MNKSNKIMFILFLSAVLVLLIGQGSVNAAGVDIDENTTLTSDVIVDDEVDTTDSDEHVELETKEIRKVEDKKPKSSPGSDVSLQMDDVEVDFGDVAEFNVVTEPVVDEGILTWYVNNLIVGAKNLSVSPASFQLETIDYTPGTYTVLATYTGSLIHDTASTTCTLKINPLDSHITNVVTEFTDDNNILVSLNVLGGDELVDYGTLNVYKDDEQITSLDMEDSVVSFVVDKKYNDDVLTLEWIGDEYYRTSRIDYLVSVPRIRTNLHMSSPSGYQGNVIIQPVTFYGNRLVNDGILDVYVDGDLIDEYTVSKDSVDVIFDLGEYSSGSYDVFLDYYASDVYMDASYSTTLTVRRVSTTLYSYNVTGHKNESVLLRAGVYNSVDETCEGMLEFFVDDVSVKTLWVDNVNVSEEFLIPDSISYGEHTLRVVYYGTNRYDSSSAVSVLNVVKYSNSLSVRNYSINSDGLVMINIRAYSYNNTVDSGVLYYYVDGTLVGSAPVTSNITCIVLPEEYVGDTTYELFVSFNESDKFMDASLNTSITPLRVNTTTRLYTYVNSNNTLNFTSYVYSSNYDEINEGIVEFYVNDTMIGRCNVINNAANILLDMDQYPDNTYPVRAVYTGSRTYKPSENNTSINYNRYQKTVYIQTPSTITQKASDTITITVNITDYEQNKLPVNTQVHVTILNDTITTNAVNGSATITYTIPENTSEGTYNITIVTDATKDYKQQNRTMRMNIIKDNPYITGQSTIRTYMGESVTFNATLNLQNDVLRENIVGLLKINNKTVYQGRFVNGEFMYTLVLNEKYTDEEYNVTIVSVETEQHHRAEKNIKLLLSPRNTYITSHNIQSKNGEQIIINATVYDSMTRKPVKTTGKACIKINDVTLENVEVINGHIVYAYINNYSAKDYSIKIIYGRNKIYNNSTWNGTLTIKSSALRVSAHNIQTYAYNTINIKANIYSESQLATGVIKTAVKINNKTIHEENITNGRISFNYTLPDDVGSGKYNLTIIAGDTRQYMGSSTTVNLTVNKNYKQINSQNMKAESGDNIHIHAEIVDINGRPVTVNTKVNIKISGSTIVDYNVTNGVIDYEYQLPGDMKKGTYPILIQAGETSGYYHATTTKSLEVL